jgi:AmmeMemoRadiSam system protein B
MNRPMAFRHWYPADPASCRRQIASFLEGLTLHPDEPAPVAAAIPHAGWRYSGAVAARALKRLAGACPATLLLFSAVHRAWLESPAAYPEGAWETPLGEVPVDAELAKELLGALPGLLVADPAAHADEHALEVAMPFIREFFPAARVLPIMAPPEAPCAELGQRLASLTSGRRVAAVASTDLTHYGEAYSFAPAGSGSAARAWMRANDQRIIDMALGMRAEEIVPEARTHRNACGPGALAAAVAFARARGSSHGTLLERTDSHEVQGKDEPFQVAVGYAGMVF